MFSDAESESSCGGIDEVSSGYGSNENGGFDKNGIDVDSDELFPNLLGIQPPIGRTSEIIGTPQIGCAISKSAKWTSRCLLFVSDDEEDGGDGLADGNNDEYNGDADTEDNATEDDDDGADDYEDDADSLSDGDIQFTHSTNGVLHSYISDREPNISGHDNDNDDDIGWHWSSSSINLNAAMSYNNLDTAHWNPLERTVGVAVSWENLWSDSHDDDWGVCVVINKTATLECQRPLMFDVWGNAQSSDWGVCVFRDSPIGSYKSSD